MILKPENAFENLQNDKKLGTYAVKQYGYVMNFVEINHREDENIELQANQQKRSFSVIFRDIALTFSLF